MSPVDQSIIKSKSTRKHEIPGHKSTLKIAISTWCTRATKIVADGRRLTFSSAFSSLVLGNKAVA